MFTVALPKLKPSHKSESEAETTALRRALKGAAFSCLRENWGRATFPGTSGNAGKRLPENSDFGGAVLSAGITALPYIWMAHAYVKTSAFTPPGVKLIGHFRRRVFLAD
jgi:hypothetical protein